MKHNLFGVLLALLVLATASSGQDSDNNKYNHVEIGAFMNYFRLNNPSGNDTNFYGAGGRIGFNVSRHVQLEAEGAYDFKQNADFLANGAFVTSPLRVVHLMFGPKFNVGTSGPVRFFLTAKGGLIDFSTDASFSGQVTSIPTGNTFATFYPGAGIEFFEHWLGIRLEAGDEMYFDGGVNHNVRVTGGPVIRF
jgi:hypothetical protein